MTTCRGLLILLLLPFSAGFSFAAFQSPANQDGEKEGGSVLRADICIYGATSSGVMAAVTAARMGKSVVLIDPGFIPGGMSSGGLGQTDIGNKYAISGLARDFYRRVGGHYGKFEQWTFEPHVAEMLFRQYMREAKVTFVGGLRIIGLNKTGVWIQSIDLEPSEGSPWNALRGVKASMFIDCSYEGDMLARAGVSYTVGREANAQYGETYNGVQLRDKHQFPNGVDPYRIPGHPESGLLWGVSADSLLPNGSGDKKIQAYNFRLCLTDRPENMIPIGRPEEYDSTHYELLLRQLKASTPDSLNWQLLHIADMPNQKTDINNCGGFSSDMIGMNHDYPEASYARRAEMLKAHEGYTRGWLYFLGHDPRVPVHLRKEMLAWGFPKDEYREHGHFTHQLYVREARRMMGSYVMTQRNCEGKEIVADGVAMAAYTMDSHNCQRIVYNGMVKNEGDVQVGGFGPYPVAYRSIVPRKDQCANLIVPVCLSASHIAYGSIRMEPVFMVLGQSAAVAAVMAIDHHGSVQEVNVTALQNRLKTNPLADGSTPEVLIDDRNGSIEWRGDWVTRTDIHGQYGPSLRMARDGSASAKVVLKDINRPGKYEVLVYTPNLGLSSNWTRISLDNGQKFQMDMNLADHPDAWVALGRFEFKGDGTDSLTFSGLLGRTTHPFLDALLFIPVPRP